MGTSPRRWGPRLWFALSSLFLLSVSAVVGQATADAVPAAVTGGSRASAYAAYQNVLKPALAVPIGWTGNIAGCVAGAPSPAAQEATRTAVNYYRDNRRH